MSRGRIEQIGAPIDIYRTPRNRFVAEFLGSSNIFSGTVTECDGASAVVRTEQGIFKLAYSDSRPLSTGDACTFVVSDDRMQLSNHSPSEFENTVRTKVIGEEFVGATATVYMETADGHEVKAQRSHEDLSGIDTHPGAEIYAAWHANSAYLLPED